MTTESTAPAVEKANTKNIRDWCRTKNEKKTFEFVWTIENFSWCKTQYGKNIESSVFPADVAAPKWVLRVYPRGYNQFNMTKLIIHIETLNEVELIAEISISLLNDKSEKIKKFTNPRTGYSKGNFRDVGSIPLKDLSTSGLLPEDMLRIHCEVNVVHESVNISGAIHPLPNSLIEDLEALYLSEQFSDVKLIVGDYEIHAHKLMLSARSKVFAAMFQNPMKEKISDRVVITDVQHEVLKEMLRFMYTSKVSNLDAMAGELLAAADKYDLINLKVMCEESLRANLTTDKAAYTLILADRHNAKELKSDALKFIAKNAKAFLLTEGWRDMKSTQVELFAEVFSILACV